MRSLLLFFLLSSVSIFYLFYEQKAQVPEPSWVAAGVVLEEGDPLKKSLDEALNDDLSPKGENWTQFGDKPHIFELSSIPGKIIKTSRQDRVAAKVDNTAALNARRVGESLSIRRVIEKKGFSFLEAPKLVLYVRHFGEGETAYAVVADKVEGLRSRVIEGEKNADGKQKNLVEPLERKALIELLALMREVGALDGKPSNLPMRGDKISLIDVEPLAKDGQQKEVPLWKYLVRPWDFFVDYYGLMRKVDYLGLFKEWNVAEEDRPLVDREIQLIFVFAAAKTIGCALYFLFLGFLTMRSKKFFRVLKWYIGITVAVQLITLASRAATIEEKEASVLNFVRKQETVHYKVIGRK